MAGTERQPVRRRGSVPVVRPGCCRDSRTPNRAVLGFATKVMPRLTTKPTAGDEPVDRGAGADRGLGVRWCRPSGRGRERRCGPAPLGAPAQPFADRGAARVPGVHRCAAPQCFQRRADLGALRICPSTDQLMNEPPTAGPGVVIIGGRGRGVRCSAMRRCRPKRCCRPRGRQHSRRLWETAHESGPSRQPTAERATPASTGAHRSSAITGAKVSRSDSSTVM